MTKILLVSLIVFSTYVFAEEDCFFRFGYEYKAQTKSGKQFNCNRMAMTTKYDHKGSLYSNLDEVYKEIKTILNELEEGTTDIVCNHSCEWNDNTDYNAVSEITGLAFYREKWCMMNPDSSGLADSELIFDKMNLSLPATFVTYKKNKPYVRKPYKPQPARKYNPEDYDRP
jgi:hypothetical protein